MCLRERRFKHATHGLKYNATRDAVLSNICINKNVARTEISTNHHSVTNTNIHTVF